MDVTLFQAPFQEGGQGSGTLLLRAASGYSGLSSAALEPVVVGAHGKPAFARHPELHFSVTHSGSWWMCAFGRQPLGLDLQIHQSYTEPAKLARRFFHPREDAWLAQNQYRDFFDLWCAKESWVKYTGTGFFEDPGAFSTVDEAHRFPRRPGVQLRLLPAPAGYSLCLCAASIGAVTVQRLSVYSR